MPNDVGVLQLSIEDNSKQAAGGLQELERALSSVKTALSGGLNLPTQSVKNFAAAVSANSKALSSTGTFLNAVKEYQKAFKDVGKVKIDTTPITELQTVLKDGIKIGQAGTQLSKLREAFTGDWGKVGESGEEINSAVAGMKAIKDMGDEFKSSGTAQNIKEVAEAIAQYTKAQKDMPSGGAHDLYGMFGGAQKAASSGTGKSRRPLGEYMQFFGNGTQSSGQISMFERISDEIQEVTNNFRTLDDTVAQQKWPSFGSALYENIKGIMDTPLEHLHDIYRTPTTSMEDYKNAADAVLPKVQKLSSEEMVMAGNAKRATAEISNLIKQLNSFGGPKGQALQGIIDVITGVSRGNAGGGMINASSTMFTPVKEMTESFSAIREATEGTIQIFDSASGAYHEMHVNCANIAESAEKATESVQQMNQSITEGIALADMPASGKNGVFANANEEFLYLTGQIEKARAETQQFFDIAMKAENQLKHGGPRSKEDLQFDYQHSIEGYERAIAAEEKYQDSLRGLMTYVQQTASEMRSAVTDTHEAPIEQAATQVSAAMERIGSSRGIAAAREEMQSFGIASGEATSKIELLRNRVEELKRSYSEISKMPAALFGGSDGKASALNNVALKIGRVNEQIEKLVQNAHKAQAATSIKQLQESITVPQHDNMQFVENMVNQYSEIDLLTIKMEGMKQALADDITQNSVDTQQIAQRTIAIQQLRDKIEELKKAQNETTRETKNSISGWKAFGKGIQAMFPTLSNLIKRFKSMIIMRSIRYLVRQLAAGLSEGVQNVYQYSKAIGGSFAPAMDEAATALQQMKNSIGAAIAPAIQALIPILQTVVNWFINLVNYVNQFFALLNGQKTWTRALPATASAFDKQTKAAKSAGAAMKDLLADWDELNIIQSQTGGGSGAGSGTKAEDYLKMFEEVNRFDSKVKDIVDFVKENFNTILTTVGLIGAGMKLWKLSKGIVDVLPTLSKIALGFSSGATIALSVALTDLTGQLYTDTGDPGWLIADALSGAVGATIAGGIAEKVLAGSGIYTASFTLALNGAVNLINAVEAADQQKDAQAWAEAALGAVEFGLSAGLAAYGLTSSAGVAIALGAVTGIGTLALTIPILLAIKRKATYRKMAYDAFANTGTNGISVSEYIKALQGRLTQITSNAQLVIDASIGFGENSEKLTENINQIYRLNRLLTSGEAFTVEESENFKTAWHNVFEAMDELSKASFSTIYAGLSEVIAEGSEELRKQAAELRKQTIEIESITGGTRGRLQKKMEMELLPTITSGTAKPEEVEAAIQEYDRIYKLLAQTEDSGISELNKILEKGKGFDFTGEDNPLQAAIDFISQISEQDFEPAKDKVREAFDAELQSINKARNDAWLSWQYGDITKEQYDHFMDVLLGDENILRQQMKDRIDEIDKIRNQTYETVIQQAWQGYAATKEDPGLARSYVDNVINPLLKAVEEAGYDVTKWRELLKPIDYVEMVDEVVNAGEINEAKKDLYQRLYDEFNSGNDAVTVHTILEMDIDEQIKKGNLEGLNGRELIYGSDYAKEFINSILQVEGLDYRSAIEGMASATGWSIEDVLKQVDLSRLDSDQLEELSDAIERIKEQFEFNNPVSAADISEASEKTKEVASYYEDMVERIKNALDSLNNGEYNLNNLNGENIARLTPVRLSASAGFNYSDSGYGNRSENEPILTEPKDPQAETANVAAGVQKGNVDVVNAIQTIIPILTQILQKESTVVVAPGSDWGRHNAKSNSAWTKMTGAIPLEE